MADSFSAFSEAFDSDGRPYLFEPKYTNKDFPQIEGWTRRERKQAEGLVEWKWAIVSP